jgi:hypothetical protein
MSKLANDDLMVRYLLADLSEEEQVQFEELYIKDDGVFEELVAVENDLIDAYVRGELSESEQGRFESGYLNSPDRRERVDFAKSLLAYAQHARASKPVRPAHLSGWFAFLWSQEPAVGIALAAGALAIVVAGSWMAVENSRLRNDLDRMRTAEAQRQRVQPGHQEVPTETDTGVSGRKANQEGTEERATKLPALPSQALPVASLILTSSLTRGPGGQENVLVIPSSPAAVKITVNLQEPNPSPYRAVLRPVDGNERYEVYGLKSQHMTNGRGALTLYFASANFANDDYILEISRILPDGTVENLAPMSFRAILQR